MASEVCGNQSHIDHELYSIVGGLNDKIDILHSIIMLQGNAFLRSGSLPFLYFPTEKALPD